MSCDQERSAQTQEAVGPQGDRVGEFEYIDEGYDESSGYRELSPDLKQKKMNNNGITRKVAEKGEK